MTLPRRPLGTTGIEVSLIGLGTVKLGRNTGLDVAPFELPSLSDARRLIGCAWDLGINLLDTAAAYGESEARLGALLAGNRQRWVLCTKAGEIHEDGESRYDFSAQAIRRSVETSLRRLRTDYLDIVLVHSDGRDMAILSDAEALATLNDLKQAGAVRAVGFSHKTSAGGRTALAQCDVIMTALSHTDRSQRDVVREAGKSGCGVLIKKPLDSGRSAPETLRNVADQPGVSSIVVGTTNPAHLERNVASVLG
ncbi:MAG: aldo/keto reductase [Gammaproteobacteria bacterium]|nr:aldo/keto reductase [Gammaproteobacteria bacterium]